MIAGLERRARVGAGYPLRMANSCAVVSRSTPPGMRKMVVVGHSGRRG